MPMLLPTHLHCSHATASRPVLQPWYYQHTCTAAMLQPADLYCTHGTTNTPAPQPCYCQHTCTAAMVLPTHLHCSHATANTPVLQPWYYQHTCSAGRCRDSYKSPSSWQCCCRSAGHSVGSCRAPAAMWEGPRGTASRWWSLCGQ